MKLLRYQQFNESIIGKGIELINKSKLKSADEVANKYVQMIYDDYKNKKNLFKCHIVLGKGYDTILYKISDSDDAANESGGDTESLSIKLTYIREKGLTNWLNDISMGRLEIFRFKEYVGSKYLVGREMSTNTFAFNENGLDNNHYDYVNITGSIAKKLIEFFVSEFNKKYPRVTGKYYLKDAVIAKYPEISKELKDKYKKNREEFENKMKLRSDEIKKIIETNCKYDFEVLNDYLTEALDDHEMNMIVYSLYRIDDIIYFGSNGSYKTYREYDINKRINSVEIDKQNIIIEKNVPTYLIKFDAHKDFAFLAQPEGYVDNIEFDYNNAIKKIKVAIDKAGLKIIESDIHNEDNKKTTLTQAFNNGVIPSFYSVLAVEK